MRLLNEIYSFSLLVTKYKIEVYILAFSNFFEISIAIFILLCFGALVKVFEIPMNLKDLKHDVFLTLKPFHWRVLGIGQLERGLAAQSNFISAGIVSCWDFDTSVLVLTGMADSVTGYIVKRLLFRFLRQVRRQEVADRLDLSKRNGRAKDKTGYLVAILRLVIHSYFMNQNCQLNVDGKEIEVL